MSPGRPSEPAVPASVSPAVAGETEVAPPLLPDAAVPVASGPPSSVSDGAEASRMNTYFGVGAVVLLLITVVVVILLAILVFSITRQH